MTTDSTGYGIRLEPLLTATGDPGYSNASHGTLSPNRYRFVRFGEATAWQRFD